MKVRVATGALGALLVSVLLPLGSASGTNPVNCFKSDSTLTVEFTQKGYDARIVREGNDIRVHIDPTGSVTCPAGSDVNSVDTIQVTDLGRNNIGFTIDLSGGPFSPGLTAEAAGVSEIEIFVNYSAGTTNQRLTIVGSADPDSIQIGGFGFGGSGANLTGDGDVDDVQMSNVDLLTIEAGKGKDSVSAAGGTGFDMPYAGPLVIEGGTGNDTLETGADGATLRGGGGRDLLVGSRKRDNLNGGPGNDTILGGRGRDRLVGAAGDDVLRGNGGPDRLSGGPGHDLLVGGGGRDRCRGGPGTDTLRSCEA